MDHIKVVIVDDHQLFREGIKHRLEEEPDIDVVGEAASAENALSVIAVTKPDLVIIDMRLKETSGIELSKELRREWPEMRILILTAYDFDAYIRAAMRAGVDGYLLKDGSEADLVRAIREISDGGAFLPPGIASSVIRTISEYPSEALTNPVAALTPKQIEVLELMSRGCGDSEIANRLHSSPRTVQTHISRVVRKLGARTRSEAVAIAGRLDLIKNEV